jgi:hypothetical protein
VPFERDSWTSWLQDSKPRRPNGVPAVETDFYTSDKPMSSRCLIEGDTEPITPSRKPRPDYATNFHPRSVWTERVKLPSFIA